MNNHTELKKLATQIGNLCNNYDPGVAGVALIICLASAIGKLAKSEKELNEGIGAACRDLQGFARKQYEKTSE